MRNRNPTATRKGGDAQPRRRLVPQGSPGGDHPALRADGRTLHPMPGVDLSDFDEVRPTDGGPFRICSPFARAAKAAAWDGPLPGPPRVPVPDDREGLWTAGAVQLTGRLRFAGT
jgi:hypothetical protein